MWRVRHESILISSGRRTRSGRHPFRLPSRSVALIARRQPRHRQDHNYRPALPALRRWNIGCKRSPTSPCPETERRTQSDAWLHTAGTSTARSRYSNSSAPESLLDPDKQQQSLLYSSDLEAGRDHADDRRGDRAGEAQRVVLDSLSEIRLLAQSSLRYRRQVLALKHYLRQERRNRAAARRPDLRRQPTRPCTASPTASSGWRSWRRTTGPSAAGCG